MPMSPDRVQFSIPVGSSSLTNAHVVAAAKAFGLTPFDVQKAIVAEMPFICRPSQFARFLIYRAETLAKTGGGVNGFSCLNARLFTPQAEALDVSKNPRS